MSEQSSFFQRPGSGILGTVILLLLWAVPAVAAMHLKLPARASPRRCHPRADLR